MPKGIPLKLQMKELQGYTIYEYLLRQAIAGFKSYLYTALENPYYVF